MDFLNNICLPVVRSGNCPEKDDCGDCVDNAVFAVATGARRIAENIGEVNMTREQPYLAIDSGDQFGGRVIDSTRVNEDK